MTEAARQRAQQLRAQNDSLDLRAPDFMAGVDEVGDGITLQVLSVYPSFALAHIYNCIAVRQIVPKGPGMTHLLWTFVGFTDENKAIPDGDERVRRHLRRCHGEHAAIRIDQRFEIGILHRVHPDMTSKKRFIASAWFSTYHSGR